MSWSAATGVSTSLFTNVSGLLNVNSNGVSLRTKRLCSTVIADDRRTIHEFVAILGFNDLEPAAQIPVFSARDVEELFWIGVYRRSEFIGVRVNEASGDELGTYGANLAQALVQRCRWRWLGTAATVVIAWRGSGDFAPPLPTFMVRPVGCLPRAACRRRSTRNTLGRRLCTSGVIASDPAGGGGR
nr:hypothetical protein Iba_chr09aCG14340 [Ipomoea batatas]